MAAVCMPTSGTRRCSAVSSPTIKAGLNGGGLNANNSVNISGTQFISNTAAQEGGGFLQWNAGYTVTVTNARFERNPAGQNGGGVWTHGTTTMVDTHVFSNSATIWGGGMFQQNGLSRQSQCD